MHARPAFFQLSFQLELDIFLLKEFLAPTSAVGKFYVELSFREKDYIRSPLGLWTY